MPAETRCFVLLHSVCLVPMAADDGGTWDKRVVSGGFRRIRRRVSGSAIMHMSLASSEFCERWV